MNTTFFARAATAIALAAALPAFAATDCAQPGGAGATPNRTVIGLTADQALVGFKTCRPDRLQTLGSISGLGGADNALVGIDFRVQDGLLYGLGNGGGVYTIDPATAVATKASQLTVALEGTHFAMDFNPAANALRVVSDSGQNLRHPFANHVTVADPVLNYTPGSAAVGIVGIGYTNNDLDANTATTLVDIDASLNQVVLQAPANNGSLVPTGKLGVDPDAPVGFDIHSRKVGGAVTANVGFASMNVGGQAGFYRVDLLTGHATLLGALPQALVDVAVTLDL